MEPKTRTLHNPKGAAPTSAGGTKWLANGVVSSAELRCPAQERKGRPPASIPSDQWSAEFGDRVHVTGEGSHDLNQYYNANQKDVIQEDMQKQCALGNPSACN